MSYIDVCMDTPFATTLRLDAELARYLQEAARRADLSVNGFLAELIRQRREAERRQCRAADWAEYAKDTEAQDVEYAVVAQSEAIAVPRKSYRARTNRGKTPEPQGKNAKAAPRPKKAR
jgi:predicted transcriptional regulator